MAILVLLCKQLMPTPSSGTFYSVWQSADGYAYGITFNEIVDLGGLVQKEIPPMECRIILIEINRDNVEVSIDSLVHLFSQFIFSRPNYFEYL